MTLEKLGPYRIGKQIGKGGMGAVYAAVYEDSGPETGMQVAIKALSPQLAMAEGFRERFEAEIESLKKLKHDGIVRLYGYGEQEGTLFYSMELVEGTSLEEELNAGRRFDWRETLRIGIQICRALKHAHDHGVIHRDIKPANVMLADENQIKIADFGIARLFGGTQLTTAGGVLGTADYMSPEQADGRSVTEKCDQYSLGCVMFALLAGRPPFRAKTMVEMLQLQRFAEPEPVRRYAVDTPDQLDRLITQLLSKEPGDRFPNVLVLSRHMEAMEKALSRPIKKLEKEDKVGSPQPALSSDVTAMMDEEATRALEAPIVFPGETSDGPAPHDLYDAPTLDQPADSEASRSESASILEGSTNLSDSDPSTTTTHFTTVDEEARRQRELAKGSRVALAAQLGGLLAALGLLGWGAWVLMKPLTADALFASITRSVEEKGMNHLSREVAEDAKSFFTRFPEDPRIEGLLPLQEQLEFQQYERKARARSRFSGSTGLKPIEQIYFDALAIAENDPAGALSRLRALLALYDPEKTLVDLETARSLSAEFAELGDPRLLVIARQRMEQWREQLEEQTASQLPALRERLSIAAQVQPTHPQRARRMYLAIIQLYEDQAWAKEAVDQAKKEIIEPNDH